MSGPKPTQPSRGQRFSTAIPALGSPFLGHGGGLREKPNLENTVIQTTRHQLTKRLTLNLSIHRQSQTKYTDSCTITTTLASLNSPQAAPPRYFAAAGKETVRDRMTVFKGFPGPLCACALSSLKEVSLVVPGLENLFPDRGGSETRILLHF